MEVGREAGHYLNRGAPARSVVNVRGKALTTVDEGAMTLFGRAGHGRRP